MNQFIEDINTALDTDSIQKEMQLFNFIFHGAICLTGFTIAFNTSEKQHYTDDKSKSNETILHQEDSRSGNEANRLSKLFQARRKNLEIIPLQTSSLPSAGTTVSPSLGVPSVETTTTVSPSLGVPSAGTTTTVSPSLGVPSAGPTTTVSPSLRSVLPSRRPTPHPSLSPDLFFEPTVFPTFVAVSSIPYVLDIVAVNVTSTIISLVVTLDKKRLSSVDLFGGHLYCIAMMNGSMPSSIGSMKAASNDGSSSKGVAVNIPAASTFPLVLRINFEALKAIQTYAIFCYPETSIGTGDALSTVLETKIVVSTVCCKTIILTNAPSVVYGDLTKHASLSRSSYVFSYILSEAPAGNIRVSPVLYLNGIMSTMVSVSPSYTAFTSSSVLQGQFILSAGSEVNGTYSMSLSVTGSSREQYAITKSTVRIASSIIMTPAPTMASCQFTDSGQAVMITFDSATDNAGMKDVGWPCSSLFQFVNAPLTTCTWIDPLTVKASFGIVTSILNNIVYLNVGDTVTLIGGLLRAFCADTVSICNLNPIAQSSSVATLKARNPSVPNVILIAPRFLGSNFNLTLDPTASYGNGGRLYTSVTWMVSAISYGVPDVILNTTLIEGYLNAVSSAHQVSRPINIVGSTLSTASYSFTLTLKNFLGYSASQTTLVAATGRPDVVQVSIIGPSYQTIVASSPITLQCLAGLSRDASKSSTVVYTWTLRQGDMIVPIVSISADPTKFSLAPYTLRNDEIYTIMVTVTLGTSAATASTIVYVANGIIRAVVAGGSRRSSPVERALTLDGSSSIDENSPSSMLAFTVRWFAYMTVI